MNTKRHTQRGSALLIVLGLLGFLLISAVAFSVSMRTEKSAAAAYRSGLIARELLTSVFAEARYTVDQALDDQLGGADPFNTPAARTAENLAPFYEGNGKYARLIASAPKGNGSNDDIAYLLDDAALRHVPTAIAATVYNILERDDDLNGTADTSQSGSGYYFDKSARWQTVSVARPERQVDVGHQTQTISDEVIGRMAWAAINVSDMLDINAIGSISQRRGIGFTGSEFAFGTLGTQPSNAELYDLFMKTAPDAAESELPIFASGADLALYAARSDGTILTQDDGKVYPFSWEEAVANDGDGPYAPFTVYSFWPDETRRKEDGSNPKNADSIACSEVDESYLSSGAPPELSDAVDNILGSSGSTLADNFYNLLRDYVDTDCVPGDSANPNNVIPTVEPVPMVSEVGYLSASSQASSFDSAMQAAIKDGFQDGAGPKKSSFTAEELANKPKELTSLSDMEELKFVFPKLALETAVRTYFPGSMSNPNSTFTIKPEGFAAVYVTGYSNKDTNKQFVADEPQTAKLTASSGAEGITGGQDILFETRSGIMLNPESFQAVDIDGSNVVMQPPTVGDDGNVTATATEITLNCLVDFFFRVAVKDQNDETVDLVPCASFNPPNEASYPAESTSNRKIASRLSNQLRAFDSCYFRVTRPVSVKFYARWEVKKEGSAGDGKATYKVSLKLSSEASGDKLDNLDCLGEIPDTGLVLNGKTLQKFTDGVASFESVSPDSGAWFSIDPRYNWISPMMGVKDPPSENDYGTEVGAILTSLSSPHWFFVDQAQVGSSPDTPSNVQFGYAQRAQKNGYVPFVWELGVENIRYGYGNSGQLLLPQEVGFLPIPLTNNVWSPTTATQYGSTPLADYYNNVAKASFFRTIPVTDFEDGALSQNMYERYGNLCTMFGRFGGENMPEEHRGIMSAFAGMDDYYLSQRLKRFAMMGIPSSIQEAARVTVDRLQKASDSKRVPSELMTDLQTLQKATANVTLSQEAKYDEFVRDYLFYVPDNRSDSGTYSWDESQDTYKSGPTAAPTHPQTVADVILQQGTASSSSGSGSGSTNLFTEKLKAYNGTKGAAEKLGQNDLTTLVAIGNSSFGDRQQLFLYIMRADTIKTSSSSTSRNLSEYRPQSTARAVALVWRDAYGQLPERVIYFQYLP